MICPKCRGVGRIPFGEEQEIYTNEEWLRQCTTEQLADVLLRFYYQDFCMNTKRRVIEWLKQPHKEE